MRRYLLTLAIILLFINISQAKIGKRQVFHLQEGAGIEDFLLVKDDTILLVANSRSTPTQVFVIDVSGPTMNLISNTTYLCTETPYYLSRFMYINATHFYIDCLYIRQQIVTNKVSMAYIDENNEIREIEGHGNIHPGSIYPITIPPNSPTFWFYGEDIYTKGSIIGLESNNQWKNTSEIDFQLPSGYQAQLGGFISADGTYLVSTAFSSQFNETPIFKISVSDGHLIANTTNPGDVSPSDRSYTFIDYSTSMSIILTQGNGYNNYDRLNMTYTAYDFNSMQQLADPVRVDFPYPTIYPYTPPWTIASFANGYFYVVVSVDKVDSISTFFLVLQQFQMPSASSPKLKFVDRVITKYQYNHNLLASKDWVYLDTGLATISRWSV